MRGGYKDCFVLGEKELKNQKHNFYYIFFCLCINITKNVKSTHSQSVHHMMYSLFSTKKTPCMTFSQPLKNIECFCVPKIVTFRFFVSRSLQQDQNVFQSSSLVAFMMLKTNSVLFPSIFSSLPIHLVKVSEVLR